MKTIRCGRGLGDSLYLQSVVRHLMAGGQRFIVKSDYPDVFRPLDARVIEFSRQADVVAHYVSRKAIVGTTQFQDCCIKAGIDGPVDLRLDWKVTNQGLADKVRRSGRPVLVVQLPRSPMGRVDGFGASLLPDCKAIQRLITRAKEDGCTVVQIGAGTPLYRFHGLDIDLANCTTVAETIDVVSVADRCLGYCSFLVPLAESLDRPALFVWSRRGLRDRQPFIRQITPSKVLHKVTSSAVIDDEVLSTDA